VIQGPLELLGSAFLHASWNALLKRERRPQGAVLGVLASAPVLAAAAGWIRPGRGFPTTEGLLWTCAAGAVLVGLGVAAVAVAGRDRASRAGVALAAVCATTIAGYHLCYDWALVAGAAHAAQHLGDLHPAPGAPHRRVGSGAAARRCCARFGRGGGTHVARSVRIARAGEGPLPRPPGSRDANVAFHQVNRTRRRRGVDALPSYPYTCTISR